ncbi:MULTISPECIES: PP2C family protein-serine/threonine phosphatase [unclassified Nocardioides]|uniref:PP2C family protein-serine/threonine phosphatase n=1 Tax=unclassified Nocardioides TaxID=2615069 RepID=UPI000A7D651B|nr:MULTISPECIES: PP2C family protein-serine/threonine phosphatase [unclassified Nocardioides]
MEQPVSGVPSAADGEQVLLAELRARLQARGKVPVLPAGWQHQSAMLAAEGFEYGGDFIVANLDPQGRVLQMVLVDVCGHGVTAVPVALQFAGALQSLITVVRPADLLGAANAYLLRQPSDESFATAVHVEVDLRSGRYRIRSAGHPPALRWNATGEGWDIDNARGTALGVSETPEVHRSVGRLAPGEALLFYTDGVVESRSADIGDGIDWLRDTAREAVQDTWDGAARRIIDLVERGEDDRAVLILQRS